MVQFLDGAQVTTSLPSDLRLDGVATGTSGEFGVFLDGVRQTGGGGDPVFYYLEDGAEYTISTTFSSTPLSTEGTKIFEQAVTPSSSSSNIEIEFNGTTDVVGLGTEWKMALFSGTTLLGVAMIKFSGATITKAASFRWVIPSTDTAARTYTLRMAQSATTAYLNRIQPSTPTWGSTQISYATFTEVEP